VPLGLPRETVVPPARFGHLLGLDVGSHLGQRQVAPGRYGGHQLPDDGVRIVLVADQVHDGDQHDRDGPGQIQGPRGPGQDRRWIPQVRVDVVQRARRRAGEHGRYLVPYRRSSPGARRESTMMP
jgi:hypothetical protein